MIRLHTVVEGQTEEEFVRSVLAMHLGAFDISTDVRCVETGRRRATIYRGGVRSYTHVKKDLTLWMKEDRRPDAYFTTMFDVYRLPDDFPAFAEARKHTDSYRRVSHLEEAFAADLAHPRFVPYLQLFEFEALLLADPPKLADWFVGHETAVQTLVATISRFSSPELIDDGEETAPSKRIIKVIPAYAGAKVSTGPAIVARIGLPVIRGKCRHFDTWLGRLEGLGTTVTR
jgi:hypothetical protein